MVWQLRKDKATTDQSIRIYYAKIGAFKYCNNKITPFNKTVNTNNTIRNISSYCYTFASAMSKRIIVNILFVFGLIFIINSDHGSYSSVFAANNPTVQSLDFSEHISVAHQGNTDDTVDIFKIRKKACDDSFAPLLPVSWSYSFKAPFHSILRYTTYNAYTFSPKYFSYSLRGPPVA